MTGKNNQHSFVVKGGKALKTGFTTGTCAAAAAVAAAEMLLSDVTVDEASVTLPNGDTVVLEITDICRERGKVVCAVKKDAGDDPDVTDGIKIFAECRLTDGATELFGGVGVGIVTGDGLSVPKGQPAINPVPRKMILENVAKVCGKYNYTGGVSITISAPEGLEIAKKTFNPRLGIEGGISILGTTGIVEPMSEKALVDTIKLTIDRQKTQDAVNILITPGNYGKDYCANVLGFSIEKAVKFANYLGECLDYVAYRQFKRILLVGHVGKLVKVAGGIMNTHSAVADCRMELFSVHAALAGASQTQVQALMACKTTDAVITLLDEWGLTDIVCQSLLTLIMEHLAYRLKSEIEIGVVVFSCERTLMQSENVNNIIQLFKDA